MDICKPQRSSGKALEGQKRDDACGFWDVQGAEDPVTVLLVVLEGVEKDHSMPLKNDGTGND